MKSAPQDSGCSAGWHKITDSTVGWFGWKTRSTRALGEEERERERANKRSISNTFSAWGFLFCVLDTLAKC